MHTNLIATSLNIPLNHQQHCRLNKINEIKDYFDVEIIERELMSKRLSKYIVLSVTTRSISIASFANVIGAPVGITSASVSLAFPICAGIVEKLLQTIRSKKKNRNNIIVR